MKTKNKIIFLAVAISAFFILSAKAQALTLSKTELEPEEFFDILGDNFGSYARALYSSVCFNDDSNCFNSSSFYSKWQWTNNKITLQTPPDVAIDGEIIVYGEGQEKICYEINSCENYPTSVEKGRASYKIKPLIKEIDLPVAKPGERITIFGGGFGLQIGFVLFDSYPGQILSWTPEKIEVMVPANITNSTKIIKITNKNNLNASTNFLVGQMLSNDEFSYSQEYLKKIEIQEAWKVRGTNQIIVAIISDGLDLNQADLKNKIWQNPKELANNKLDDDKNGYIDDVFGWDFINNTAKVIALNKYGTMAAGIITANRNNSLGISGITDSVKIMPITVCDSQLNCPLGTLEKGIYYAVNNQADIIYINLGAKGTIDYSSYLNLAIQYAYDHGSIVVVPAGNEEIPEGRGQNLNSTKRSLACNNNDKQIILSVASLLDNDQKASWSNYGSNCVNISAPGINIAGTVPPEFKTLGDSYYLGNGTSFSAAIVAGVASEVKAKYPKLKNWEIIDRLIYTAANIDTANPSIPGQIGGRVNAYQALVKPALEPKLISIDPKMVNLGGKTKIKVKNFNSNAELKIVGGNFDLKIANNYLKMEDANNIELTIPANLANGTYSLKIIYNNKEVSVLNNALQILWTGTESQKTPANLSEYGVTLEKLNGSLVKAPDSSTVYLINENKRYSFPNQKIYQSWYGDDFSQVKEITFEELANYRLTGNITYKPGSLIKIPTVPKVYLVTDNGNLRWVQTEEKLNELGFSLNQVQDLSESFFVDYLVGIDII